MSNDVNRIYSNEKAFAALKNDGKLITWGSNDYGGNTYNITALENVKNVYATKNSFTALKNDDTIVCWPNRSSDVSWNHPPVEASTEI